MTKWRPYIELMRFHKPIGTFLLLWPTLWALWLGAGGMPSFAILSVFVTGVIVMRAAGCVINDIADRHFDKSVSRTKNRALARGDITVKQALILFVVLCTLAAMLLFFLEKTTIVLAFVALFGAILYPFTKRYIYFPQVILGLAWYMAIPMAFSMYHNLSLACWLLYAAAVVWTVAFDTMYALCDKEDDIKIGVKSTAIVFADKDKISIALLQLLSFSLFLIEGLYLGLKWPYYAALIIAAFLGIYQQWLIKDRDPERCLKAFLNNNWVGMVIFLGIVFSQLLA